MRDYPNRFPGSEPASKLLLATAQDRLAGEMSVYRYMLSLDCRKGFGFVHVGSNVLRSRRRRVGLGRLH